MTFEAWTAELVRTIRETIPDAKAMRRGLTATITNGDRIVRVEQTGGTVWCCAGDGGPQGFTLAIGDHTPATARNAGISLASHLRDEKPVAHVCQENGG